MNKYHSLIFAFMICSLTFPAKAETFSYSSASLDYSFFSSAIKGFSEDFEGEGKSLDLSFSVRPNLAVIIKHLRASAELDLSGAFAEADITSTTFGLLGHAAMSDTTDFILAVSFINGEADVDVDGTFFNRVNENGGISKLGVRTMIFDSLELNWFIHKRAIEDRTNMGINLGAAYHFKKSASIDFVYSMDRDKENFELSLTKYF
jgi:hypothetical protein